jgi:hypothetical protein
MPDLVSDLINHSAGLIGALTQGAGLNDSEYADGLKKLNLIVDGWNAEPDKHYAIASDTSTLASGTGTYTLGTGGTINRARPVLIHSANIILSGLKHPLDLINQEEYNAILEPGTQAQVPRKLYDNGGHPLRTLKFFPVPSGTPDLEINSPFTIALFAALNSAVALPPAYYKALVYTLATDWAPSFRLQLDPMIPQIAAEAQAAMKVPNVLNFKPAIALENPAGAPARGTPAAPAPTQ